MPDETGHIEISDYVNVATRTAELGCRYPEGLALLPVNFDSASSFPELLQASEAATIRKLLKAERLPLDELDESQRTRYVKNKSRDFVAPVMFVGSLLWSQNPDAVSLALNVIGNYATAFFQGDSGHHEVHLEVVVEKKKNETYKKISYRGPAAGLRDVNSVMREVMDD